MNFSDIKVVQFNFSLSILMFGLEKLIYLHKGKYSLYFNSLTTSVLGLSFGLGLVCTNSASAFEFDKKLVAPDGAANDFFGTPRSVSLSGNTALVGSFLDDDRGTNSGSAYLFDVTTGELVRKLTAPDGAANDSFGGSVSLYGDTALVSSNVDDDKGLNSGSAYLFDVTTGNLLHKLTAPDGSGGDIFGISVSLSANTALIGSYRDDDKGTDSGSAYLFDFTTGDYLGKLKAPDGAAGDWFGYFVSLSGNTALVGSPFDDDKGTDSGSAYLFDVTTGNLLHKFTAPNGAAGDRFGFSVSLSGNNALVGSHFDDDKGTDSGSAYLFVCHHR